MATIPQLKEKCREYGIKFSHKWKKADYIAALKPTEFVQQWVPQVTFSNKFTTCSQCNLMQPSAVDKKGNALCFSCVGVKHRVLTKQELDDMGEFYNAFWQNQILEFKNMECTVTLEKEHWFSISAPLKLILNHHLKDLRNSYYYEWDTSFSTDYRDYSLVNFPGQLNFDQTLGEILTLVSGCVRFPKVPTLDSMAQNVVRKFYNKGNLFNHKILPTTILESL